MSGKSSNLLTIVVPCYNAEKYLPRCLASLSGLDCDDVSILFVNDGSTDSTKKIVDDWTACRNNSSVISKENGGYSTAINMGLDNCVSKYVMFLGVDDEVIPHGVSNICNHLRENEPDILAFSTQKYYDDENGNEEGALDPITVYRKPGVYCSDIYDLQKQVGSDSWILFTRDTSRCFRLSVIGNTRYLGRTGVSADGCFSSIIACKSKKFEFVNEPCYCWHLHRDSVSGREKTVKKMKEEAEVWASFFEWMGRYSDAPIPNPIIHHYFVYRKLIKKLSQKNEVEYAGEHKKAADAFAKHVLTKNSVSLKSRIKLMFPTIYALIKKL